MGNETISKVKALHAEARVGVEKHSRAEADEGHRSPLNRFVHFWTLVARSFTRNRCPVRASALAYTSLLALVPMLAVVVSVSSSLLKKEGEKPIEQFIERLVGSLTPKSGAPAATSAAGEAVAAEVDATHKEIARNIKEYIDNIRSGTLGATGMVVLVFMAISMLSRIEETFNDIWGVTQGRSWFARIVQYWAAITLGPLCLVVALALTSGPHFEASKRLVEWTGIFGQLLFQLLPVVVLCLAFALFYQLMPNTRVQWRAALVGGVVGGGLWHLNNVFSVLYVSRVITNSKIYGSLGMVPVFMIGLYFSWIILLFGAQVAYTYQNRHVFMQEQQIESVNQRGREFIGLRIMTLIGERFDRGDKSATGMEIAQSLEVPSRLTAHILGILVNAGLLVEVVGQETAYAPARPMDQITCYDILEAVRTAQGKELATRDEPGRATVEAEFAKIQTAERQVAGQMTLKMLARQASGEAETPR